MAVYSKRSRIINSYVLTGKMQWSYLELFTAGEHHLRAGELNTMIEDMNHDGADDNYPAPAAFRVVVAAKGGHFASI